MYEPSPRKKKKGLMSIPPVSQHTNKGPLPYVQLTYKLLMMILTEEDDGGHATWVNGIRCV